MINYLMLLDTDVEKDKFKTLYELYNQKLFYIAYSIVKDEQSAEDMVHNTFLILIDNLAKIDDVSSHKTYNYVVTILRNCCFNYIKREQQTISYDMEVIDIQRTDDDMEEMIINKELVDVLCLLLNRMKFPYRDVLVLQYYNRMSSKEIGEILNLESANVRQISRRAKGWLKKKLEEMGYN